MRFSKIAGVLGLGAVSSLALTAAAQGACNYTTSGGVNNWTCTGTTSSLGMTASRDSVTLGIGVTISNDVTGLGAADSITISGGRVNGMVDAGAGNDTLLITSGRVGETFSGGSGNDTITVQGGTVGDNVEGDAGYDTIRVEGGTIGGTVIGEEITVTGGTIGRNVHGGDIDVNNIFLLTGGTVEGAVLGFAGDDSITVDGTIIGGNVEGGDGADTILVESGSVGEKVMGNAGADQITIRGGSIGDNVEGGGGWDVIRIEGGDIGVTVIGEEVYLSAGTVGRNIYGGDVDVDNIFALTGGHVVGDVLGLVGDDMVTVDGAAVDGTVDGGEGADTLTLISGTIGEKLKGGDGDDLIEVRGGLVEGSVEGDVGWDRLYISGGTVQERVIGEEIYFSGGRIEGDVYGGEVEADNIFELTGGSVGGNVLGLAGADTIVVDGTNVTGAVDGGNGEDQLVLASGSIGGKLKGGLGDDVIRVEAGLVGDNVEGDSGWDEIHVDGGTVTGSLIGEEIYVAGGTIGRNVYGGDIDADNVFRLSGGTVEGNVLGLLGDDDIRVSGSVVVGSVEGGSGADNLVLVSGSVGGALSGGEGDDLLALYGGLAGSVDAGIGEDVVIVAGATVGAVEGGEGDDEMLLAAGTAESFDGGQGDDAITLVGGSVGSVGGAEGSDAIRMADGSVGSLDGGVGDDTLLLTGGSVGSVAGGEGDDDIVLGGAAVESVNGGAGSDVLVLLAGPVGRIDGSNGDDVIQLSAGFVSVVGGGEGNDEILLAGASSGRISGGDGGDSVVLSAGSVGSVSGDGGNDTILVAPLARLSIAGAVSGGAGDDTITFSGAVGTTNLSLTSAEIDGGTGRDILRLEQSALALTSVAGIDQLDLAGSFLVLESSSYNVGDAGDGVVNLDAASRLVLTAGNVALTTGNFNLGSAAEPGATLVVGSRGASAAVIGVSGIFRNNGTIELADGATDDVLTINGAYAGGATAGMDGGSGNLLLDVVLTGKGGAADTLVLTGGAITGTTTLHLVTKGSGGVTGHGIGEGVLLVDASGASMAGEEAFQLAVNPQTGARNEIIGPYLYELVESTGGYYLQSDVLPQVPAYVIGPSVAATYSFMAFNTLDRRLGEVRQGDGPAEPKNGTWQAWARVYGGSLDVSPSEGWGFEQQAAVSQFGMDQQFDMPVGKMLLGAFAGYGTATATLDGTVSQVRLQGWSFGGYLTYYADARPGIGAYLDLVGKVDLLDSDFSSSMGAGATDTTGWGGSAEIGYGFALPAELVLKPQAELTYLHIRQAGFTDSMGLVVDEARLENLVGRFGVQLQTTVATAAGTIHTPYLVANVLHDFLGGGGVTVAGSRFGQDIGGIWYTFGAGITSNVSANFALYAQAGYSTGDVEGWTGNLGLRARW